MTDKFTEYLTSFDGEPLILRTVGSYAPEGNYLHSDLIRVESRRNVALDDQGIPTVAFPWGTHHYPITVAQYALQKHALSLTANGQAHVEEFLRLADYFVQTQDDKGGWAVGFDHTFLKGRTGVITAPWYSAMAQGQAVSTLVRAYSVTRDGTYLKAARNGLAVYALPVDSGGVLRKLHNDLSFYEEYPTQPASLVLNGFLFSLLGLYDLYRVDANDSAESLYRQGVRTLKRIISLYDLGNPLRVRVR